MVVQSKCLHEHACMQAVDVLRDDRTDSCRTVQAYGGASVAACMALVILDVDRSLGLASNTRKFC